MARFCYLADILKDDDVLDFVKGLTQEESFNRRDRAYTDRRAWVYQEADVDIGIKTQTQYRPPEIEDDGHSFKNRILAAPMKVQVSATKETERSQKKAQNQENFLRRHYYHWRDRGEFDSTLFDMATLGIGWQALRLNPDALPLVPDYDGKDESYVLEEGERQIKKFLERGVGDLFASEYVQPDTMYWTPDKQILCHAAIIPMYTLQQEYGKRGVYVEKTKEGKFDVRSLSPGENVDSSPRLWSQDATLYTLDTDEYCYHLLLGEMVDTNRPGKVLGVYRNYFGRPAFFYTYGERTGSRDPLKEFRPLTFGKYQTVPAKAKLITGLLNAGIEAAQMRYALKPTKDSNGFGAEGAVSVEVTEEGFIVPPDGYEIVAPNLQMGVDVEKAIQLMIAVDTYGYPKALNRPEEVQANSGYDRARQQDAVASLLNPPLAHFGSMLSGMFGAMLHAVKEIGTDVSVQNLYTVDGRKNVQETIVISPSDIVDADISVDFNSITLFNQIAMIEEDLKLMQADLQTETRFFTNTMGIDDPEAFRLQRSEDKVRKAADDRAITDVLSAIDALRGVVVDEGMAAAAIEPMVQTTGGQIREDRGASMPIGPGQAMPLEPTPPGMAEQGAVMV